MPDENDKYPLGFLDSDFDVQEDDGGRMIAILKNGSIDRLLGVNPPEAAAMIRSLRGLHFVLSADEKAVDAVIVGENGKTERICTTEYPDDDTETPERSEREG
jgi:hypothetical protein